MADGGQPDLALAGEFPAATWDEWRRLVDRALKGAAVEERACRETLRGLGHGAAACAKAAGEPGHWTRAGRALVSHAAPGPPGSGGRECASPRRSCKRRDRS